jgi:hypothetical protein
VVTMIDSAIMACSVAALLTMVHVEQELSKHNQHHAYGWACRRQLQNRPEIGPAL